MYRLSLLRCAVGWLAHRYAVVVVASELRAEASLREVHDKLERQLRQGGTVVITGQNLQRLSGGLLGVTASDCEGADDESAAGGVVPAGAVVTMADGTRITEPRSFRLCSLKTPQNTTVLASIIRAVSTLPPGYEQFYSTVNGRTHYYNHDTGHLIPGTQPLAVAVPAAAGGGRLVVLASPFGAEPVNFSLFVYHRYEKQSFAKTGSRQTERISANKTVFAQGSPTSSRCRVSSCSAGHAGVPGRAALRTTASAERITPYRNRARLICCHRFLCPAMIRVDKLLSYDAVPLETADHLCARR